MNEHLSENQLTSYVYRTLTDVQRETMDVHIGMCQACRARLGEHQALHRRARYSILDRRREGNKSSQANFAEVVPRLRRSRRMAMFWAGSKQFVYGTATLALLAVLVVGLVLYFQGVGQWNAGLVSEEAMYKGGPQRTGVYDVKGPKVGELRWQFRTQGRIWSSPTIVDGVVYFGSMDRYLYALDTQTGEEKWKFKTGHSVISTPAVVDGTLYFGSGCIGLSCSRYPGSDYYFYALDRQTGQEKWRFKTEGRVGSAPLIADGLIYFGSEEKQFYAVDRLTGQEKWRLTTEGGPILSSPALGDGVVYFGTGCYGCVLGGKPFLYAVDSQTGQERWRFETDGSVESTPTVAGGVIYFGSGDTFVYAVDSQTGQEKWRFKTDGPVQDSLAVSDGVVYVGSRDGNLYAIDGQTGQEKWKFETGGPLVSASAIADGVVYVGSEDDNLYAVDSQTGEEIWRLEERRKIHGADVSAISVSAISVADGVVYFGSGTDFNAVGDPQP